MKSILIILIFLSQCVYGQRRNRSTIEGSEIAKADSLEALYENDRTLKTSTDTLPVYFTDDNLSWRDIRLVTCFYDSLDNLVKIAYRNGLEGYYYFYFEGINLIKIRTYKNGRMINIQCYFTIRENLANAELIRIMAEQDPANKEYYELYLRGKEFLYKYKNQRKTN